MAGMGMGSMDSSMKLRSKKQLSQKLKVAQFIAATYVFFAQNPAFAINFIYTPSISIQESYSDNIRLAPEGFEKGAFVTEITPAISITGVNGGRLSANFDYRMQNLFNAGGDGGAQMFHQLNFDSGYIVSRNRLNVNARASYGQQNISNLRGGDNVNNLNARTNVWTVGAAANWTPHFGTFADAQVTIDFGYVGNDSAERLANSTNLNESISIVSGLDFKRVTWNVNFNNSTQFRENEENVHFQNTNATLRTWLDRRFNLFATLGYANNSFEGLDNNTNGFFYTVGAQWKPTWYFDIEAGYGNNWHVSSNLSLSQRTHLSAGYNDRSVGLNTGGAWNVSLNHSAARSTYNFTYTEDTTTVQQLLLEDNPFVVVDVTGNPILGNDGQPIVFNASLPSLSDDVLVRRTANVSATYTTGVSNFQLGGFYEIRDYENRTNDEETVYGINGSWSWNYFQRTSVLLTPSWQHIKRDNTDITGRVDDDRYQFSARITRTIPLRIGRFGGLSTSLEYRFVKQNSSLLLNNYMENRVTLSLSMRF